MVSMALDDLQKWLLGKKWLLILWQNCEDLVRFGGDWMGLRGILSSTSQNPSRPPLIPSNLLGLLIN